MTQQQKVQRSVFLQTLEASTKNIVEQYEIIFREANRILLSNPSPRTRTAIEAIVSEYDLDLVSNNEKILTAYSGEMENIGLLGGEHVGSFVATKTKLDVDKIIMRFSEIIKDSVVEVMNHIYPDGLQLSQRLWNPLDREKIISTLVRGYQEGISTFDLAERVMQVANQTSIKSAYRVAHTELVRMYSKSKYDSIEDWNNNSDAEFSVMIKRELSPAHKIYDICDVLQGTYDSKGKVPAVPSHPGCLCMITEVFAVKNPTSVFERFRQHKERQNEWGVDRKDVEYF
jgi:hypothetical protein